MNSLASMGTLAYARGSRSCAGTGAAKTSRLTVPLGGRSARRPGWRSRWLLVGPVEREREHRPVLGYGILQIAHRRAAALGDVPGIDAECIVPGRQSDPRSDLEFDPAERAPCECRTRADVSLGQQHDLLWEPWAVDKPAHAGGHRLADVDVGQLAADWSRELCGGRHRECPNTPEDHERRAGFQLVHNVAVENHLVELQRPGNGCADDWRCEAHIA